MALYLTVLFIEFSPAALEWLGLKRARNLVDAPDPGADHLRRGALHPASVFPGRPVSDRALQASPALVLLLSADLLFCIEHHRRAFHGDLRRHALPPLLSGQDGRPRIWPANDDLVLGFGKAASWVLAGYFIIKIIGIAADNNWHYLATGYGAWYLVELFGFVALPCLLYAIGVRDKNLTAHPMDGGLDGAGNRRQPPQCLAWSPLTGTCRPASGTFPTGWRSPFRFSSSPSGVLVFRFIVTRMPIFYEHPDYDAH